jgi:hypothetical protein
MVIIIEFTAKIGKAGKRCGGGDAQPYSVQPLFLGPPKVVLVKSWLRFGGYSQWNKY